MRLLYILAARFRAAAFLLGMIEFRSDWTWGDPARTGDGSCFTDLDNAYDWGREWAHRLTRRHYDW